MKMPLTFNPLAFGYIAANQPGGSSSNGILGAAVVLADNRSGHADSQPAKHLASHRAEVLSTLA